jgi:hypothetical protein
MKKRRIFRELMMAVSEMAAHRKRKIALRTYNEKRSKLPKITEKAKRQSGAKK